MNRLYFPEIEKSIAYEGPDSNNSLAFRYYSADQMVGDKTMADHLRFAIAYWHTFMGNGADMFGQPAFQRSWHQGKTPVEVATNTLNAAFEFLQKLGVNYYCFHDRDLAPEGESFAESCTNLESMVKRAKELQEATGIKLLWGTANLFGHPRYANGASTNPDAHVFAYAAAQVKAAIDATHELDGENYVFWGGREGYESLLNTDLKHERDQLARFLHMAVDYKKHIGFDGQFLIEPKPCEPTKHQYDTTAASALQFLREYDLLDYFKLNIEANHATLAGNTFEHELLTASIAGKLGSVDANRGDTLLGWDTDQFPTNLYSTTMAMLVILRQGGLGSGGLNFDAKPRRTSIDAIDLFHAHIGGMDTFARSLLVAQKILDDGVFDNFVQERYNSYSSGFGKQLISGQASFEDADQWVRENGSPTPRSGRQEMLENMLNDYISMH